jgi:acyl-CoA synthetase (AMP-forming)/AMP-acid ligase II
MTVLVIRDLVPAPVRQWWAAAGYYAGKDLFTLFDTQAQAAPARVAVIDDDGETTYQELREAALRLAGAFTAAGVRPGEVIAVQLWNGWLPVAVDLAAAAMGAVVLPYPVGRGRRDTLTLLGRSRAVAVVIPHKVGETCYSDTIAEIRGDLPHLRTVVVSGVEGPDSLEEWARCGPLLTDRPPVDAAGPARILVSSGSESTPKMIVYSHDALAGGRGAFIGELHHDDAPMRNFFLLPLASSFGSSGTAVTIARYGGTLIVQHRFDAARALDLIEAHRPYLVFGVPTMFAMMLDQPRLASMDTSSIRAVVAGGSRVDRATVAACRAGFGAEFVNCYGSADGINCTTDPRDPPPDVHSAVGRPNPAVAAIRVVGEDGRNVPTGEIGEVQGLGPMSPLCYVDREFDERYRVDGGWVCTGDLGRIDSDGYLHIVGRHSEIIIRGGRNVSPVEVELLIAQHPAVRQVACVGVADELMGERMAACIALREHAARPTILQLTRYLTEVHGLEPTKLPEYLEILDVLPLSVAGKIDKRWLRERLSGDPK